MTMFDHVEFSVQSFEQSVKFYTGCLPRLGYKLIFSDEKIKCFGFGSSDSTEFLLTEGKVTRVSSAVQPGYYAAFVLDPDSHNIEAVFRKTLSK